MEQWSVTFTLLSDTIFGSGESVPGLVDLEITYDENGIPLFKGKTFKGKLREEAENIMNNVKHINPTLDLETHINKLFGQENKDDKDVLKFSNCTLSKELVQAISYGINTNMFTKDEVIESFTNIQSFITIDENGVTSKGSLRKFRIINKGCIFISELYKESGLNELDKELLAASVSSLRHIGTMVSRGKGEINASLLLNGEDVTKHYLELFLERVEKNDSILNI